MSKNRHRYSKFSSSNIKYLFLINKKGDDFVTTSFLFDTSDPSVELYNINKINIFNFTTVSFCSNDFEYLTIDYTSGDITSRIYQNSENLQFYKILKYEIDIERSTCEILVEKCESIDLLAYKRNCKLENLIKKD